MKQVRVMTIFGTRPEAIKMAPLVAELQRRPGLEPVCCVTAQHREMLDSVLEIFQLRPDYDLNIICLLYTSRSAPTGFTAERGGDTSGQLSGRVSFCYHL